MKSPAHLVAHLGFLLGCSSAYEISEAPGRAGLDAVAAIPTLAAEAREGCKEGLEPLVHCEVDGKSCRQDPLSGHAASDSLCATLRPLLTFAHLSDAQLREERVALDGPFLTPRHRRIDATVRRNPVQERYDFAVLLGTVLAINRLAGADGEGHLKGAHPSGAGSFAPGSYAPCPAPLPPSFVLHTGSAVGAGLLTELSEFLTIASELEVPFFNAVGSHDALFFGALPGSALRGLDVILPFGPIGRLDAFLGAHRPGFVSAGASRPASPSRAHPPTSRPRTCLPPAPGEVPAPCWSSQLFGFDLICPGQSTTPKAPGAELCTDARGYYGQDVVLPNDARGRQRKVRLLVLNTAEIAPAGVSEALDQAARGRMRDEQYLWLRRELSLHREQSTVFLVAGHHDLDTFVDEQRGWLRDALGSEPRVVAYLAGHAQVNGLQRTQRSHGAPLLEIVAGSTQVYPQLGNLVDLLEGPPGALYVRVRSFRQRVGDAWSGNECGLKYLAASGRNGAYNDRDAPDRRDESVAVKNGNGLFLVSGFD